MPSLCRWLPVLATLITACGGGDPSGPSSGSLAVAVTGLPAGTPADVTVTGPGGYIHRLAQSDTLPGLAPGSYAVNAQAVMGDGEAYQPAQTTQSVTVSDGATPAAAEVAYGSAGASLSITISGLPAGSPAAVTVTGPDSYTQIVTASTVLANLAAGIYTITAESVSPGGSQHNPSPATQTANLALGGNVSAGVSYTPASSSGFNVRIDGLYLTQGVQSYGGTVPLVKDRDGYLRVFVTASESNLAAPAVRVRFYHGGTLASEATIPSPTLAVPLSPNEGSLTASWNLAVSKTLIQPNLSILAEVDPANAVAESNETDNAFPASGTPVALDVRTTSTFSVRMVPIHQSVNGRTGNVTNANKDGFFTATMRLHPLAGFDADLRAPFTTDRPAVQSDEANGAWTQILNELNALRTADGSSRYYFGVVNTTYSSGVAGVGYIGGKTSMGWDKPGADHVAAHEWGHNWGRQHAPCGDPGGVDASYPYADGVIGVYGFDVLAQTLKPPTSSDLMGYCAEEWISDYTYKAVLNYRGAETDVATSFGQAVQPSLLVWGRIVDGHPVLEPAFRVVTRPSLPARPGRYQVEGTAADGASLFRLSFAPEEVADDPRGGRHFAFAVPLQPDRAGRLHAIRLSVPGRQPVTVSAAASSGGAPDVRTARVAPGRVSLRWDAALHPMVMVRDPSTGQVLSFARGGRAEVVTDRDDLELQVSNGVGGRSVRVAVPAR